MDNYISELEYIYTNFCKELKVNNPYMLYEKQKRLNTLYEILKGSLPMSTKKNIYFLKENCEGFDFNVEKTGPEIFILEYKIHTYALINYFFTYDQLRKQKKLLETAANEYSVHLPLLKNHYPKIQDLKDKRRKIFNLLDSVEKYQEKFIEKNTPKFHAQKSRKIMSKYPEPKISKDFMKKYKYLEQPIVQDFYEEQVPYYIPTYNETFRQPKTRKNHMSKLQPDYNNLDLNALENHFKDIQKPKTQKVKSKSKSVPKSKEIKRAQKIWEEEHNFLERLWRNPRTSELQKIINREKEFGRLPISNPKK